MIDLPELLQKQIADLVAKNAPEAVEIAKKVSAQTLKQVRRKVTGTYTEYLKNSCDRYAKAKSFNFREEPRFLYDFYVPVSVSIGAEIFRRVNFTDIDRNFDHCVISGFAGSGKSIFLRHLFLSIIADGSKIPIFVELRSLNDGSGKIHDALLEQLTRFGFFEDSAFLKSAIKEGHLALLFDGFDEVDQSLKPTISKQIRDLSTESPECTIVVTSRPDDDFGGWENFSILSIEPLDLEEAVELVDRLPYENQVKESFTKELRGGMFKGHVTFLSNPLLLSIMVLTYRLSANIPHKLSLFYAQAYDALFQRHDASKEGYKRKRYTNLDSHDFSTLFSAFCLQTYDARNFEFTRTEAIHLIKEAKEITEVEVDAESFLNDALQSVNLLVEEGLQITFSHRSFQEYFVSKFICSQSDAIQRQFLKRYSKYIRTDSVLNLCYEMNPSMVERQYLLPALKAMFSKLGVTRSVGITHYAKYLKLCFYSVSVDYLPEDDDETELTLFFGVKLYRDPYSELMSFVCNIENYSQKKTVTNLPLKEFKKRYIDSRNNEQNDDGSIALSSFGDRSPLFRDISNVSQGIFSIDRLKFSYRYMKRLEQKHKNPSEALARLLKAQ